MTAFVTLAEVKANARVDHDDEDGLLAGYMRAAVALVSGVNSLTGVDVTALPLDDPRRETAREAVLLHTSYRYENRGSVLTGSIATALPHGFEMYIQAIRVERY